MKTMDIVDIEPTEMLLKNMAKFPQTLFTDVDNRPLPYPEEELISHEEFIEHFEKRLYERLGLKIKL